MSRNVGNIDRLIRIVVGLVLIALSLSGTIGLWGWIGILPLLGGLVGWCPAYTLFHISTCKRA
jgi:hypothetical protein